MTATDLHPPQAPVASNSPRGRRPWVFLGVGAALAAVLAVILFAGVGTKAQSSSAGTNVDTAPHINEATGYLLSLNTLNGSKAISAPAFSLTDQFGHPMSPAAFRGKVVVLSFNDDQCTDLCTLLANDIVAANQDLGSAAKDVAFLSVNVNPFYPQVSAVKAWGDEHGLGTQPNWWFGNSTDLSHLESVWHDYGVYVELDHRAKTVVHSTELFFIDPSGRERAVAEFGAASASTALFAHGMAQMASDLLPAGEQHPVGGPVTEAPLSGGATIGAAAPAFSLDPLVVASGSPSAKVTLSSLAGHYGVIDFWSSTCTACKENMPDVEQAYKALGAQVDFVGIDVADHAGPGAAFARATGVTYPLGQDPNGTVSGVYRITGLPYTVLVDPNGKVLVRHPGIFTTEQLEYVLRSDDPSLPGGG